MKRDRGARDYRWSRQAYKHAACSVSTSTAEDPNLLIGCSGERGLLAMAMDGVRAPALALAFSRERARGETLRERVTSTLWPENVVSLLGEVSVNFPKTRPVRQTHARHARTPRSNASSQAQDTASQYFNLCALKFRSFAGKIRGVNVGGQAGRRSPHPLSVHRGQGDRGRCGKILYNDSWLLVLIVQSKVL